MSEDPIYVVDFDGRISRVYDSGEQSEVIIYLSHVVSDDWNEQNSAPLSPTKHHSNSVVGNPGMYFFFKFTHTYTILFFCFSIFQLKIEDTSVRAALSPRLLY
ncbi:unnamed protein product [Gongylonema pulchrum]|uniref:DUF295 domain-containing protein n=1 Tax=Gongylonema pulchrum TaxID=637853 RepID=A0A183ECB4_9BILA|nr:unnamed protein product [Gongylonema pulchrum]